MATYTDSYGFNKGTAGFRADGLTKVTRMEVVLDFAKIAAARTAAGATALASGDVLEVIPVPAKSLVMRVGYDVTTAEGATATFDLGDASDTDGYLNDADLNAVGSGVMALTLASGTPNNGGFGPLLSRRLLWPVMLLRYIQIPMLYSIPDKFGCWVSCIPLAVDL